MEDKNKTKIVISPELQKAIDQFNKSIEDARATDVPEDKILKTKEEVDKYFLGE